MNTCAQTVFLAALLFFPCPGFGQDAHAQIDFFGISVTNKESEADGMFRMGYDYYTGEGVEKDPEKALACFTKAAGLGHSRAQFNLGLCYMNGAGVEQSDKEAAIWFERAARQDIKEALYPLGICHYNLENYTEAYAWALYAESQGDTRLREMLDPMYSEEEIDAGKTRFRELKKTLEQSKI